MDNGNEDVVDTFYSEVLAFYSEVLAFYSEVLAFYSEVLAFYSEVLKFYSEVLAFYRTAVKEVKFLAFNDVEQSEVLKHTFTGSDHTKDHIHETINVVPYNYNTRGENELEQECRAYDVLELSENVKQ